MPSEITTIAIHITQQKDRQIYKQATHMRKSQWFISEKKNIWNIT